MFHYEIIGEGKPIIMLHGLGCDLRLMKGCMEPLFDAASAYKRIYIDLLGMGNSSADLAYAHLSSNNTPEGTANFANGDCKICRWAVY